jgi:mannosyl alpha-1,6-glycoprotein beta-1,6-N-acetyl-glucosaminyltransferase, isozyme B
MRRSLVSGLGRLGYEVVDVPSLRRLTLERLRFWRDGTRNADLLFTDPWKLQAACQHHLLGRRALDRCLVLEWFGTPPERTAPSLGAGAAPRYLTPYPYGQGWNTFLGFVLHEGLTPVLTDRDTLRQRLCAARRRKKPQGVVWGKETRYLEGHGELLARLADLGPLHVTATRDTLTLPHHPGIVRRGVLSRDAWREVLAESSYLIGLGDPVLGPSPLEALAEGCLYIDPRYPSPRYVNDRPELPVRSQHPFAAAIGPPFVLEVDLEDHRSVQAAVEASFTSLPPPESSAWNAVVDTLEPFTVERHGARLRGIVERWRARHR